MPKKSDRHPNFREEVPIEDEHLKRVLLGIAKKLPDGWCIFSDMTENGLHAMGCEKKRKDEKLNGPTLVQLPGLSHTANAFRNLWAGFAKKGIQTMALTPAGTAPSKKINKPIEVWQFEDLLIPYFVEVLGLVEQGRKAIFLSGHSLGGNLALQICDEKNQNIGRFEKIKEELKGYNGLNAVKACDITKRMNEFQFKNGELSFDPAKNREWILGLYGIQLPKEPDKPQNELEKRPLTPEVDLDPNKKNLPKDIKWIEQNLRGNLSSAYTIDDYSKWPVNPHRVTVPTMDINGFLDNEEITGIRPDTILNKCCLNNPVDDASDQHNEATGLRMTNSQYCVIHGDSPWGRQIVVRDGTHNSLLDNPKHYRIVIQETVKFIRQVLGQKKRDIDFNYETSWR